MALEVELQRRRSLNVSIRSIENSDVLSPLRLVVDCEMKCHMFVVCLEVQTLFGFAVAVEDGAYEHWQDGVDEPDEQDGKGDAGCILTENAKDKQRPTTTDGDVSRRYGWEDCHHHVVEWDGNHVLHEGHVHATEVERKGELDCPDDIAKHGPCDGFHEERIGHVRERKGELAHLGVVPLVARKVTHEVRQETK